MREGQAKGRFPSARRLVASFAVALALSGPASAIDLLEAYELALASEPTYRAARAEAKAAREVLPQAQSQLLPNLQGAGSRSRAETTQTSQNVFGDEVSRQFEYTSSNYSLTLRQPIYRPQAWAAYKQAEANVDGYLAKLDGELQTLGTRVAGSYFEALLAEDALTFTLAQKQAYLGQLDAAKRGFKLGEGTRTEIDEAQARYDLILAQELQARQNTEYTRRQVEALVSVPITSLARLVPARMDLGALQPSSLEAWIARAEDSNPQLRQLTALAEAARQEVAKARAGHLPTLDFFVQYRDSDSDSETTINQSNRTSQIGLQMTIPLYAGGYTSSTVRQALANVERLQEQMEASRRALHLQVRKEYQGIVEGQENIRANEVAVNSAEQVVQSTQKGITAGTRTSLDVLNALQQKGVAARDLARARYLYAMSRIRLLSLTGSLDAESIRPVNYWLSKDG